MHTQQTARIPTRVLEAAVTAAAYGVAAAGVAQLDWSETGELAPIWPAAGIGVAAVWLLGWHAAVGVAIGGAVASLSIGVSAGVSLPGAVVDAAAVLFGGLLLRHDRIREFPCKIRSAAVFVAVAVATGLVDGLLDAGTWLLRDDGADRALSTLLMTSLTNSLGIVLILPVVAAITSSQLRAGMRGLWLEWTVFQLVVVAVTIGEIVIADNLAFPYSHPLVFMYVPLLMLAAFWFGPLGTSLTTLHVGSSACIATGLGVGPFVASDPAGDIARLSIYLWVIMLTPLLAAAALRERATLLDSLRRASSRAELLSQELDHRVRNNLASLLALIGIAESRATSNESIAGALRERIYSMSEVHRVLGETQGEPTTIRVLLDTLVPNEYKDRFAAAGDALEVVLDADQVRGLGSVFYEFLSNALEHGALATSSGTADVLVEHTTPAVPGRATIAVRWTERGTRALNPSTIRAGWGMQIVRDIVAFEFHGTCEYRFTDHGVDHRLEVTLRAKSS